MKQKYYTKVASETIDYGCGSYYAYSRPSVTCSEVRFDTYEDAVAAAKKTAAKLKEDVEIYKIASVVQFPLDDLKVVEVA